MEKLVLIFINSYQSSLKLSINGTEKARVKVATVTSLTVNYIKMPTKLRTLCSNSFVLKSLWIILGRTVCKMVIEVFMDWLENGFCIKEGAPIFNAFFSQKSSREGTLVAFRCISKKWSLYSSWNVNNAIFCNLIDLCSLYYTQLKK